MSDVIPLFVPAHESIAAQLEAFAAAIRRGEYKPDFGIVVLNLADLDTSHVIKLGPSYRPSHLMGIVQFAVLDLYDDLEKK